jgi:hypothetical protein
VVDLQLKKVVHNWLASDSRARSLIGAQKGIDGNGSVLHLLQTRDRVVAQPQVYIALFRAKDKQARERWRD